MELGVGVKRRTATGRAPATLHRDVGGAWEGGERVEGLWVVVAVRGRGGRGG